ncbi:hypothetical protein SO802_009263 [Lithocarpus litseifolius]|uniref:Uncharacterized protein n=1 Tax=Lithocarpus litseifolius TaxID=425828 RepID=A0AAW2DGH7_9ROSI
MSQAREPPILRQRNNHLPDYIVLNILSPKIQTFGSVELPSMSVGLHFRHLAVFEGNLALIEFPFGNHLYLLVQVMREYGVWDQLFAGSLGNGMKEMV